MKMPRDLTGLDLIKKLKPLGYGIVRQTGSHIRIQTQQGGEHNETIPRHDPIKIGTLNNILTSIAAHFGLTKDQLVNQLFR